jgi:hypothetical protein
MGSDCEKLRDARWRRLERLSKYEEFDFLRLLSRTNELAMRKAQTQSSLANIQDQKAFATIAQKLCSTKLCAEQSSAARKTRDQKESFLQS